MWGSVSKRPTILLLLAEFCKIVTILTLQAFSPTCCKGVSLYGLPSKLLKGGYIGDYIGDYYRSY